MNVDIHVIEKMSEIVAHAQREIKDAKQLPGRSDFRRDWTRNGGEDVKQATDIWRTMYQARAQIRRQLQYEQGYLDRLAWIDKNGVSPSAGTNGDLGLLRQQAEKLRDSLGELKSQIADEERRQAEALQDSTEQLKALKDQEDQLREEVKDVAQQIEHATTKAEKLRDQLELLQDEAARLGPLIAQAKRQYNLAGHDSWRDS